MLERKEILNLPFQSRRVSQVEWGEGKEVGFCDWVELGSAWAGFLERGGAGTLREEAAWR